ncbi:MAG: YeeE/YedE family protein [Pseudomonadales bacterium]|nr:YeeE/YedE family protein [Pseudomonadales bacterium]
MQVGTPTNGPSDLPGPAQTKMENILISLCCVLITVAVFIYVGNKQGLLFILGSALGLALHQASFGFTAAFSNVIKEQRTEKLRAQMLMLIAASTLMLPLFAQGEFMGQNFSGKLTPISTALASGAFLFGVGMQMGGGCASGTLSNLSSGSFRMGITLTGFIVGSLIGTFHVPWWNSLPSLGKFSMLHDWGLGTAILVNITIASSLWLLFIVYEKTQRESPVSINTRHTNAQKGFLTNNWPLIVGALLLAVLNMGTLLVKGKPWGVTSGFALWGGKIFTFLGGDLSGYEYWQSASWSKALAAPVLKHSTSIMNFGLVLGVLWAAKVGGKISISYKASGKMICRLLLGGLLLGYGARLASGCNIGAYFSGIASGSLHGWVWFAIAFFGNVVGYKINKFLFTEA